MQIECAKAKYEWMLIFCAFLALLVLAYLPLLTSGFIFHDDFTSVLWNRGELSSHPLYQNSAEAARWGAVLLIPYEQRWLTTHTSIYLRFIGVLILAGIATFNFCWLTKLKYPVVASFTIALVIVTLPPLQATIFNITCQIVSAAVIVAQASFICIIDGLDSSRRDHRKGMIGAGVVLLLVGHFTYASGASYFLVFLLLYLLAPGTILSTALIRRCERMLCLYFAALAIYYTAMAMQVYLLDMPESQDSGRGLSINPDVLGQLWFYLTTVIPKTLTFWYIAHAGHPFDNTATIMIALLALGFSGVGIKALLSSKQVAVGEEKRKLALQALAIIVIIVPLSAAFPLVAVPGRFVPYRTLASHMAMGFILAFWGTRFIGLRLLQGYRHIAWAKLYAPLAVVTFALVCCSFMLERYIVRPMNFEQDYVQSKLSGLQASDTHINIALRQDPSRSSYLKEGSIDADGWGACITCFYWWGVPLVVSILQDHGFKISDPVYIPEENKLTWNHGQIVVLSSPQQEVPKGALIIDMHDLFTLSSGL